MKIQICFLKRNDILSRIVKRATLGIYSHVFVCIDSLIIAETDFIHNFRLRLNPYKKCDYDKITLDLKDIQKEEIMDWIIENNGVKYDNLANVRYLLGINKPDNTNKLNCCESVINCLIDCAFLSISYRDINPSPTQLYHILESRCNNA